MPSLKDASDVGYVEKGSMLVVSRAYKAQIKEDGEEL